MSKITTTQRRDLLKNVGKIIIGVFLLVVILSPAAVFAFSTNYPKIPAPVPGGFFDLNCIDVAWNDFSGCSPPAVILEPTIANIILFFFVTALWIGGVVAFITLIYTGLKFIISGQNPEIRAAAKDRLQSVFWGIAILFLSVMALNIINPEITTLRDSNLAEFREIDFGEIGFPSADDDDKDKKGTYSCGWDEEKSECFLAKDSCKGKYVPVEGWCDNVSFSECTSQAISKNVSCMPLGFEPDPGSNPDPSPGPSPGPDPSKKCPRGNYATCLRQQFNAKVTGTRDSAFIKVVYKAFSESAAKSSNYTKLLKTGGKTLEVRYSRAGSATCSGFVYDKNMMKIYGAKCLEWSRSSTISKNIQFHIMHEAGHVISRQRVPRLYQRFYSGYNARARNDGTDCYEIRSGSWYLKSYSRTTSYPASESLAEGMAAYVYSRPSSSVSGLGNYINFSSACRITNKWMRDNIYK